MDERGRTGDETMTTETNATETETQELEFSPMILTEEEARWVGIMPGTPEWEQATREALGETN
jgi:hypothetical protein